MKTIFKTLLAVLILVPFTCLNAGGFSDNEKIKKVDIKPKSKTITYHYENKGKKAQLIYRFSKSGEVMISFKTGSNADMITIKKDGNYTFVGNGQTQPFSKNQRAQLLSKLKPRFKNLLQRNTINSSLGLDMIKNSNDPVVQSFTDDLPLVILIRKLKELANGTDCTKTESCSCFMDGKSDSTTCPCGSIVQCHETTTMVCTYDSQGNPQDCDIQSTCVAVCYVPQRN